ncbi:NAC domain-containing protein 90 [Oryza sativa Japonica Group]|jgi:hypothetical protein|uniref:No apical meristem protein, expressed n=5 Tax=Oryza sativa TaxID=4530 RepID=Q2QXH9_ORYSJ|nr:NAC domain-containing protein 90 [Oryza sativa Japonica Group]AJO53626.1 NAC-related protein 134 [Oryza sativa]EAY82318.1 hypothetical protein OsI_37528 [Oryza sativa Indica Group]ABA96494.1 No apical meristem protein, expressed [Oryza sativa Japonica Group]KAF2906739.1 hypothetical protein DAI22_12g042700 [Oryza sativa Japonica Group]BAF29215.1 Os12g0156100 [Oryza sativa Japonica Group]|eukprot:NP_001066196.1 Os12g0156100 [Oryza sativa Japonica Group]
MVMSGGGGGARIVSDPAATPGFRFYPTEEELIGFYLRHRLAGTRADDVARVIPVVDVYGYHPSQLAAMAGVATAGDREQWFFFCPRAERELHGGRPARTTPSGYWKATGSPSFVFSSSAAAAARVIGVKRTMVFYQGRAPSGTKTRWKMNEYKAVAAAAADDDHNAAGVAVQLPPMAPPPSSSACVRLRNELSVCRVYVSTGTLRSFDRRPLDAPPVISHHQPQLQQQQRQLPSSAAAAATNGNLIALAGGYECSHDSSGGSSEDAAIDWSSLITAATDSATAAVDFSFNDDIDFSPAAVGPWAPQL